jgi:uncharacterized protein YjlB
MNLRNITLDHLILADDLEYPNNPRFALILYLGVLAGQERFDPGRYESLFESNAWYASWRDGVYPYHHYHSTAHEALGIYCGSAVILFGGEYGTAKSVQAGDVVVIPAGVSHKRLTCSSDFAVVGGYPTGQKPDIQYGRPGERPRTDRTISRLQVPKTYPVYGADGPLLQLWK